MRRRATDAPCPLCGAAPGELCSMPSSVDRAAGLPRGRRWTGRPVRKSHVARAQAAGTSRLDLGPGEMPW